MNVMANPHEPVFLARDCDAILIPEGTPIRLHGGTPVFVTQALGGSVTVNVNGNLARIAAEDVDALGMEAAAATPPPAIGPLGPEAVEALVWAQLRDCYDPEIPINIVDLGLVYRCDVSPDPESAGAKVAVLMTLTAPGCGMGQVLVDDVRSRLERLPSVTDVEVDLTFDPPWNQEMMSEAARLQTGMY